ncbi:unnamed protein product [Lymnaea stagnalis]|uniref:EGF-like domain-containing protein n=1 Tax=Lymnaea stagnalis TaxID=6523 RepID=A0AAV2I4E8_LYMST
MSNPCKNGGLCVHSGNNTLEYVCECPLGYFGDYCLDQAENMCDVVNCSNNATCSGNSTHFHCDCLPGLTGTHCEVDINDCQPSPCSFGQCVDQRNGFKCVCNPGYYGNVCSEVHSPCDLNPCQNGGYCQETKTKSGDFAFICHCLPGWGGIACTEVVPVCLPNPCKHGRCVSVKTRRHNSFTCKCDPGFTGSRCEVNINDCDPNPCKFGGHCKDGIHTHNCLCLHSHAGSNCQFTLDLFSPILEDVDIAGGIIHNPSHTRNLYIVAGTLTAAVVIMILVLIGCYCRISQSYHSCCCMSRWFWYKKDSDLVVNVDVTSAYECPLAVDSFWKHSDSETEALSSSSSRNSFQNHTV